MNRRLLAFVILLPWPALAHAQDNPWFGRLNTGIALQGDAHEGGEGLFIGMAAGYVAADHIAIRAGADYAGRLYFIGSTPQPAGAHRQLTFALSTELWGSYTHRGPYAIAGAALADRLDSYTTGDTGWKAGLQFGGGAQLSGSVSFEIRTCWLPSVRSGPSTTFLSVSFGGP